MTMALGQWRALGSTAWARQVAFMRGDGQGRGGGTGEQQSMCPRKKGNSYLAAADPLSREARIPDFM